MIRWALFLVVCWSTAFAELPYTNPVLGDVRKPEPELADPFILRWCGEYWMYCSGSPIVVHHSTDLVHWKTIGPVLSPSDKADAWNQADVWAPEVVYRDGRFYMHYTASRKSADWRVGEMTRRVGVAVADRPEGPFVDVGRPATPVWAIDGTVFQDPDGGREYMFWSYLTEPGTPGAGIVAAPMTAMDRVSDKLTIVTRGSQAWEDKDGDPQNGSVRYTNEAPVVLKRHGMYHLMYSGGSWDLPTYAMSTATSRSVLHADWNKAAAPLLRSTPLVDGPGHNTLVKAPNGVDDLCVYHARTVPFLAPWNRLPFVERIHWVADRMAMAPPSSGALAPPDRPLFADRFDRADGVPGPAWKGTGSWRIAGGVLRSEETTAARIVPEAPALVSYLFEANVRAGGGVSAWWVDDANHVDLALQAKALVVTGMRGGKPIPVQRKAIAIRPEVWHQLISTRDGARLSVALDGVNVWEATDLDRAPARVALLGKGEFRGVSLTNTYDDAFEGADPDWASKGGTWVAEQSALSQVAGGTDRALALKGDASSRYEFAATLKWRDAESALAHAGIVGAAAGDDAVLAGWDRRIWPLQRFHVWRLSKGQLEEITQAPMVRGFDYDGPHTIRVVRQDDAFTFWLDQHEVAAVRVALPDAQPGLYTEGVRAAFLDASHKRLGVEQNLLLTGGFETEQWDGPKTLVGNPWALEGEARPADGGAHSGLRRLVIAGKGAARQRVALSPGKYLLQGFAAPGSGQAALVVTDHGGAAARAAIAGVPGAVWSAGRLEFEVTGAGATIAVEGTSGADGAPVAFDDLYLSR